MVELGKEAEQLRKAIEKLYKRTGDADLRYILDSVDARDSLAYLENTRRDAKTELGRFREENARLTFGGVEVQPIQSDHDGVEIRSPTSPRLIGALRRRHAYLLEQVVWEDRLLLSGMPGAWDLAGDLCWQEKALLKRIRFLECYLSGDDTCM